MTLDFQARVWTLLTALCICVAILLGVHYTQFELTTWRVVSWPLALLLGVFCLYRALMTAEVEPTGEISQPATENPIEVVFVCLVLTTLALPIASIVI